MPAHRREGRVSRGLGRGEECVGSTYGTGESLCRLKGSLRRKEGLPESPGCCLGVGSEGCLEHPTFWAGA